MQISRIRLSDKTPRLCCRVQRHLQFLKHYSELIGCPISRFLTAFCVCLELRSLPSPGITRLHRYYEPLRHPRAPGLSLAGFQLVVALTTPWGFPCCVRFPCVHAAATTPAQRLGVVFAQSPSRVSLPRKGCRVGLRIVLFEVCSAFTLVAACTLALSPIRDTLSEGFSHFVTSIAAPAASGWSVRRVGLAPTGKRRLVTAHTQLEHQGLITQAGA